MKKHSEWMEEGGQLVVVEDIDNEVHYRYTEEAVHYPAHRSIEQFLKRMELVKE